MIFSQENETADSSLYFLKQGQVDLMNESCKKVEKTLLKELKPGDCFGQHAFFAESKTEETAVSRSFSMIYKISRKRFIELLQEFPKDYVIFFSIAHVNKTLVGKILLDKR